MRKFFSYDNFSLEYEQLFRYNKKSGCAVLMFTQFITNGAGFTPSLRLPAPFFFIVKIAQPTPPL